MRKKAKPRRLGLKEWLLILALVAYIVGGAEKVLRWRALTVDNARAFVVKTVRDTFDCCKDRR